MGRYKGADDSDKKDIMIPDPCVKSNDRKGDLRCVTDDWLVEKDKEKRNQLSFNSLTEN